MVKSQVIAGIIFIIIGLLLFLIPVVGLIYGPICFIIGLALIIFRNKEDEIEKIKTEKTKKKVSKK
jgi:uncharacterized protein involved in cysteine biosynthesis|tara:strand:- start:15 stop:212 length:198 start_codon:yes stop_codon:yes gene_type:complete